MKRTRTATTTVRYQSFTKTMGVIQATIKLLTFTINIMKTKSLLKDLWYASMWFFTICGVVMYVTFLIQIIVFGMNPISEAISNVTIVILLINIVMHVSTGLAKYLYDGI